MSKKFPPQNFLNRELGQLDPPPAAPSRWTAACFCWCPADSTSEPRFRISDGPETQLVFRMDMESWSPGKDAVVGGDAFGYPVRSLADLPPGRYWVQALLNRYETFHRSDGRVVKLPADRGEGQQWNRKPGNLYSIPRWIQLDARLRILNRVTLDQEIPPIPDPPDTRYVKHVKITSRLLSTFWGRPMTLGANVLLPEGWDTHPDARYPLVIDHGHFPYDFDGFRPPWQIFFPAFQRARD